MISEMTVLFSGLFFLVWKKDRIAVKALACFTSWIKTNNILAFMSLIFVCGLSRIDAFAFVGQVPGIFKWLLFISGN